MTQLMKFDLLGRKELIHAFNQLPRSVDKTVRTAILRQAAKPTVAMAKALAPQGRYLRKSIRYSTVLRPSQRRKAGIWRSSEAEVFIGPSGISGLGAHLIEFGTAPRHTKSGHYTGQVTPHPFMRPAWDATKYQALEIIKKESWKQLVRGARNLRRRAERYKSKLGI